MREGRPVADTVLHEVDGAVATITINRPAARNALTAETKVALLAALRDCSTDETVRAVILTGAGQAFCSGQDLREHAELLAADSAPLDTVREHYNPIIATITGMPKPVIAALPGVAAGAGAGLAFACDFRVASERASLLLAFARVGLGADSGTSWTLQRLVGLAKAAEMLMLAEPVDAATALRLGLLTSVVPEAELPAAAAALAARLAAGPTLAYAAIKDGLLYSTSHTLGESLEKEADLQVRLGSTADHRAATLAFLSKEAPVYQGR
ncbi:MAG TPA: enoyl-CoA hydratase-related protein [Streptosporangiaceae bacterium]|nr:enoyl-CoA hydratase-related protein [Streptosporangiaceae bacterium]